MWRKAIGRTCTVIDKRVFSLPPQESNSSLFRAKYDRTQQQLQSIAAMDDLLSGLSHTHASTLTDSVN